MEEFLRGIFVRIASNYGYDVACLVIFIIVLVYLILRNFGIKLGDKIPKIIYDVFRLEKKRPNNRMELREHLLFQKINYWLNYRLKNIQTSCIIREKLFADILSIRFKIMMEEYKKLIECEQYEKLDNEKFGLIVLSTMEDIYSRWYKECEEQGIPKFLIDQFDDYLGKFVGMGRMAIVSIFDANFVNTNNHSKLYITLSLVCSFEEWLLSELERMLNSFNGEIANLTYKGVKCQICPKCEHERATRENSILVDSASVFFENKRKN